MITGEQGAGNWQALFGKRPTEKDPSHGHLAGRPLHSEVRTGETDRPRGRHRAPVRPYALSWLRCFRRLQVRWDRDAERWFAFVLLAGAVVCCNRL
jgi:hypothetical protein